jgi:hypothetical protein
MKQYTYKLIADLFLLWGSVCCRIEMPGVVERMQIVLQGFPDLIRGFNTVLPRGHTIRDDQEGGRRAGDA